MLARQRNWQKARIKGITFNKEILTEREQNIINSIQSNIQVLLNEWDENSIDLGLFPLPVYEIESEIRTFTTKDIKVVKMHREHGDKITKL